jgi:hypothetical protein
MEIDTFVVGVPLMLKQSSLKIDTFTDVDPPPFIEESIDTR